MSWRWFYGSVWPAAIAKRKRQRLAILMADGPTRSWAEKRLAVPFRSALRLFIRL